MTREMQDDTHGFLRDTPREYHRSGTSVQHHTILPRASHPREPLNNGDRCSAAGNKDAVSRRFLNHHVKLCRICKQRPRAPKDSFCQPCREAKAAWLASLAKWFASRARPVAAE